MDYKALTNFIYEMYYLTWWHRTGWDFLGIQNREPEDRLKLPLKYETIAFHEIDSARDAFFISLLEQSKGIDIRPEKAATMMLFHDSFEVRTGDLNAVSKKYTLCKTIMEQKAFRDMISGLNPKAKELLQKYKEDFDNRQTITGIIGKEADRLQMLRMAKHLKDAGYAAAQEWIENSIAGFKMEEVKKIAEKINKSQSFSKDIADMRHYAKYFSIRKNQIKSAIKKLQTCSTKDIETKILQDAVMLKAIFNNKIHYDKKIKTEKTKFQSIFLEHLHTEAAKKIVKEIKKTSYTEWWQNIK